MDNKSRELIKNSLSKLTNSQLEECLSKRGANLYSALYLEEVENEFKRRGLNMEQTHIRNDSENQAHEKNFDTQSEGFESLFSFERMLSIKIIKIVYFLGLIGIVLSSAIIAIVSLSSGQQHGGSPLLGLAYAAGILVLGTLVWRVVCEFLIVIFSINDKLTDIKELLKK